MDANKERFRRIRGLILKLLVKEHPKPTDLKVLYCLLDDLRYAITDEEFASHLAYLEGKGYVSQSSRKTSGVEIVFCSITPHGIDIVDGFKDDVGVDVSF